MVSDSQLWHKTDGTQGFKWFLWLWHELKWSNHWCAKPHTLFSVLLQEQTQPSRGAHSRINRGAHGRDSHQLDDWAAGAGEHARPRRWGAASPAAPRQPEPAGGVWTAQAAPQNPPWPQQAPPLQWPVGSHWGQVSFCSDRYRFTWFETFHQLVLHTEFVSSLSVYKSTSPPPNVRIINGYVTVDPPLTRLEQHRRLEIHPTQRHLTPASAAQPGASSAPTPLVHTAFLLGMLLAWMSSDLLFSSWPHEHREAGCSCRVML